MKEHVKDSFGLFPYVLVSGCCLQERASNPQSGKTGKGKSPNLFLASQLE